MINNLIYTTYGNHNKLIHLFGPFVVLNLLFNFLSEVRESLVHLIDRSSLRNTSTFKALQLDTKLLDIKLSKINNILSNRSLYIGINKILNNSKQLSCM